MSWFLLFVLNVSSQNTSYKNDPLGYQGYFKVGIGSETLNPNNPGFIIDSNNVGIGHRVMKDNFSGSFNVGLGNGSLHNLQYSGSYNVAVGYSVLHFASDCMYSAATGNEALRFGMNWGYNTASGNGALYNGTNARYCVAGGHSSLRSNSNGKNNVGIGNAAFYNNDNSHYNTVSGDSAAYNYFVFSDGFNTAMGAHALTFQPASNPYISRNTALGAYTLNNVWLGSNNFALGDSAGYSPFGTYPPPFAPVCSGNIFIGRRSGNNDSTRNKLFIGNGLNNTIFYGDLANRRILLGKSNPAGFVFPGNRTLYVMGGVISDSVRLMPVTNWSDYVFNDNYKLMPLDELEQFIKTNKHLPGMPSAEEVRNNGIELSDISTRLLEKIEELTLYILLHQKEIDEIKTQLKKKGKEFAEVNLLNRPN